MLRKSATTVGVIVKGKLILEDSIENIKREFLRKAGYTIIIETNRPVNWGSAEWNVTPLGENRYRVVASEDIREELHDFVASQGAKILTMQVKEPSLEEIFLNSSNEYVTISNFLILFSKLFRF